MSELLESVLATARFLEPISASSPAGRDLRLESEHEQLRVEVAKLSGVRDEKVDWALVCALGSDILLGRSKDLLIAVYLACALSMQRGLLGATQGCELVAGLLSSFGGSLFPVRARARANAIDWFLEWMTGYLETTQATLTADTLSLAQVQELRGRLTQLHHAVGEVLGSEAPLFDAVSRSCDRLERAVLALTSPAPTAASSAASAATSSAPGAEVAADVEASGSPDAQAAASGASVESWLQPLPGTSAAGVDSAYDEQHVEVRLEIEKLSGLGSEAPDWRRVLDGSSALLSTRSKDLTLATYLTAALLELRGLAGLSDGLTLCAGLLDRHWDSMFPPLARIKRRTNSLDWLSERVAQRLALQPAQSDSHLRALELALTQLSTSAAQRFGSAGPNLTVLSDALARLRALPAASEVSKPSLPAPAAMNAPATPASMPASVPPRPPAGAPARAVASATNEDADQYVFGTPPSALPELYGYVQRAGAMLVDLAQARFEVDRLDARSYRWLRSGVWLRWERAPAPNRRGRTDIDGPSPQRRAELFRAAESESWDELLTRSEQQLAKNPLWLDPNRWSALALEKLGADFAVARAHVERESRVFFARLPELASLQFADGTPFGSVETLSWLKPAPSSEASGPAHVSLPEPLLERLQRAEQSALSELEELLKTAGSSRRSFLLRLELARALERGQQTKLAVSVYLGLERDIDGHDLERWEPELALQVFRPLWGLLGRAESLGVAASEGTRICARLARLLPTALLPS